MITPSSISRPACIQHDPFNDTHAIAEGDEIKALDDWDSDHGFKFDFDKDLKFEHPRPSPPLPGPPSPPTPSPPDNQPYHVYDKGQKWFIIIIIGAAGLFSGLSSNIFFPAMDEIATVCF